MLVFSSRVEALGLRLHSYLCFISCKGLFFSEHPAWAPRMYPQI